MSIKREIKIRGVSARALAVLEEMAAARSMSRNALICKVLEKYAVAPELEAQQEKSDSVLLHVAQVLEGNLQTQQEILRLLQNGGARNE